MAQVLGQQGTSQSETGGWRATEATRKRGGVVRILHDNVAGEITGGADLDRERDLTARHLNTNGRERERP